MRWTRERCLAKSSDLYMFEDYALFRCDISIRVCWFGVSGVTIHDESKAIFSLLELTKRRTVADCLNVV